MGEDLAHGGALWRLSRQQAELNRHQCDEEEAQQITRGGIQSKRNCCAQMIHQRAPVPCLQEANGHRDKERNYRSSANEQDILREILADYGDHRAILLKRVSEISMQHAVDVCPELVPERTIKAMCLIKGANLLRRGPRSDDRAGYIARQKVEEEERNC